MLKKFKKIVAKEEKNDYNINIQNSLIIKFKRFSKVNNFRWKGSVYEKGDFSNKFWYIA